MNPKILKVKILRKLLTSVLLLLIFLGSLLTPIIWEGQSNSVKAYSLIRLPLSTRGSNILDKNRKKVTLRGVNWFGIETSNHVPHGLWKRDYKTMLSQIKGLGYNFIRLPYSLAALQSEEVSGIDFTIGQNHDLKGKTPIEIMDIILQEAQNQGLLILLDCHRLNDERIGELWYGDGFTEEDWINTWLMLAKRYKDRTNIIGADLKNEPHGRASWGTNIKATDWRLAAERAGNAIGIVNPDWLIVVEGVEKNVPNQKLKQHWQGGNLEGVRRYPVRLSIPDKLVYSPHEYGPGVYNQPYFSDPKFPKNLRRRWNIGFYYIKKQKIAPILVGEFGGRETDKNTVEGKWQNAFVRFLRKKKLGFAYWSWNPNSADTGGLLLDDWYSINIPKQKLISKLLPVKFNPKSVKKNL